MTEINDNIAHVKFINNQYKTHDLQEHLLKVSALAGKFALTIGSDWARISGLWHDLGKYRPAFQAYIKRNSGYDPEAHVNSEHNPKTAHASTGAIYAAQQGEWGLVVAYLITGHHAGLPDYESESQTNGRGLREIINQDQVFLEEALIQPIPETILNIEAPQSSSLGAPTDVHLWIRMQFSCLVDADFLDTEAFMNPQKNQTRDSVVSIQAMLECFNTHMQQFSGQAITTRLNTIREEILMQSRQAAQKQPAVYTMTVPTGGGKTLSSLAFALEHAVKHHKRRIIYAIPYTSIIEQTAGIFRQIFEPLGQVVLEHHSHTDADQHGKETSWSRLATENWDAPLIVTTTVQLFESLYAARTSRCRKLHNLVNSVIVIDETQLLPVEHLKPIRHVIDALQRYYAVTFVLSTATPTGLDVQKDPFGKQLLQGINSTEIVHNPEQYYAELQRVTYTLPHNFQQSQSWVSIRNELMLHESVLCVVNKRQDARDLHALMPKGTFHLSALMCAEHRSQVIATIRERLLNGKPTRLISTQLIEAGVDLDFPVVYRAMAGLDSIAQTAGRCNREGFLETGQVVVFIPPTEPPGLLKLATQTAISCLSGFDADINRPDIFIDYFTRFFAEVKQLDKSNVLTRLQRDAVRLQIQFRSAAQQFRLIDDEDTVTVFVRFGEEDGEVDRLLAKLAKQPERWLLRQLQRYSVTLYRYQFQELLSKGLVEELTTGYFAQSQSCLYDETTGLQTELIELNARNTIF